jgi:predicted amino acid dehydrogenase
VFPWKRKRQEHVFAFLVHSRDVRDFYRKFPFSKKLPKKLLEWILFHMWPITVSRVTGLHTLSDGREIFGYIIGIPMTAKQMMTQRKAALRKIRRAVVLARNYGLQLIGLGGLTSSLSKGGLDLLDIASDISITTGHAYTAVNVTENIFKVAQLFNLPKTTPVAVVGASGSIGATTAKILARDGFTHFLLIDTQHKSDNLTSLIHELKILNPSVDISCSHSLADVAGYTLVVTATNAPEALITTDVATPGMIIIDDAQPSDIHPDVLKLPDVLSLEAGVVHTPHIYSHFNMNLKHADDNFCCMAELLLLAAREHTGHYVINRATLAHVDEIKALGEQLGFRTGEFQNFMEKIPHEKIERMKRLLSAPQSNDSRYN